MGFITFRERIAIKLDISLRKAEEVTKAVSEAIREELQDNNKVELTNIGTFTPKYRPRQIMENKFIGGYFTVSFRKSKKIRKFNLNEQ